VISVRSVDCLLRFGEGLGEGRQVYCGECARLSVRLSARSYLENYTPEITGLFARVYCRRGSVVVLRRRRDKLAFHDANTDTDADSPNTATILHPTHAISSRDLARK